MRTEIKQQAIPEKRAPVQREHLLGIDPRIASIRRLIALHSLSQGWIKKNKDPTPKREGLNDGSLSEKVNHYNIKDGSDKLSKKTKTKKYIFHA